jgi:hypothetical protein
MEYGETRRAPARHQLLTHLADTQVSNKQHAILPQPPMKKISIAPGQTDPCPAKQKQKQKQLNNKQASEKEDT